MITLQDTRVLISVQLVSDTNELVYLFAFVTSIFAILAGVVAYFNGQWAYIAGWCIDIREAATFTGKVITIAVKSVAFGLGVI